MTNTKRNTEMSPAAFLLFSIVATCLFALGMNALMNHMDAKRDAEDQMMAEYCRYKPDAKRPLACITWELNRNEDRVSSPRG